MGFRAIRPARRVFRAIEDAANFRSLHLTGLCLKGWADAKMGRRSTSKEVVLDLKRLKLCVDIARVELISYWEVWHELCYEPIAMDCPKCVVDVGANIGAFSLYQAMVKQAGSVIAFEPSPDAFVRLAKNVQINGLLNVRVVNAAVGDKQGVLSFSEGRMSVNSKVSENGSLKVPCMTLDTELSHIPSIDILKVDTEGYEMHVLQGASETLKKTKRIACELHYPEERQEIDSLLLPLGFYLVERQGNLAFYSRNTN